MRKTISFAAAAVISVTSLPLISIAAESEPASGDTLKIMCIGDSITDGYVPEYAGSYRKFIYDDLTKWGYNVDMVGVKDDYMLSGTEPHTGESFEYDNANVGYSGYSVKSYSGRNGIYEVLESTNCLSELKPDVVTLMIGTNNIIDNHDMDANCEEMGELINFILRNIPEDSILIVSGIQQLDPNRSEVYDWFSNYRHSADWQTSISDEEAEAAVRKNVDTFNAKLNALTAQLHAQDDSIGSRLYYMGDYVIGEELTGEYLFDGVHPNNEGYAMIGHAWSDTMDQCIKKHRGLFDQPAVTTASATTTAAIESTTAPATTTAAIESTTAPATTTEFAFIDPFVTTEPASDSDQLKVSDMVMLSRYLINAKGFTYGEERTKLWDLDNDGRLSVFDLALMRQVLTGKCEHMNAKMKEMFGEDWTLYDGDDNFVYIPDDNEWVVTSKVTNSNVGSNTVTVAASTELQELDTKEPDYSKLDWDYIRTLS